MPIERREGNMYLSPHFWHSKAATGQAIKALFGALGVGTPRRMLSTISGDIKMAKEEHSSQKTKAFVLFSPHLPVYQPQMNSLTALAALYHTSKSTHSLLTH
ncbi:unnamed protein product [Eruca vesicaria subsp. sativa]|uniref:Uncharacterized protein n=1 Tax=Eruca vesicaria subsp. sativa TaxID=29727 RepID=A0ABC8JI58_ERUVS|nr:unnamed protein product [Eruca vesicaria subsp. sativa]